MRGAVTVSREPGAIVRARELAEGCPFKTVITQRPGTILERRSESVLVEIDGHERRLHPRVFLEVQ